MHVAHMPTNIHTWYLLRMTFGLNQTTPKFLFSFSIYLPIKKKMTERHLRDTVQFLQLQMRSRDPKELASSTQYTVHSSLWSGPVPAPSISHFSAGSFCVVEGERKGPAMDKGRLAPTDLSG